MHARNGLSFSLEKEGNPIVCDNVDRPWEHLAKWLKSDRKREILCGSLLCEILKIKKVKLKNRVGGKMVSKGGSNRSKYKLSA